MKKKTIRNWLIVVFILGLAAGLLVPVDLKTMSKKMSGQGLKADIFDVSKRMGQLDVDANYFKYSVLAKTETGSIEILKFDDRIPKHMHPKENHFVYILRGRAKGTVGDVTAEVGPGQMVAIPAGVPHSFERVGDSPVEVILFSTPPFVEKDIVWLESD